MTGLCPLLLCTALAGPDPVVEADVVLRGATLYDGSGAPGVVGDLALRGDRIVAVGPRDEVTQQYSHASKRIDAPACYVFPGLINTHTHLWQALLKGLEDDIPLI